MQPTLINDWYLTTDQHLGTSDTSNVNSMQQHNAGKVYTYFTAEGWTLSAIAGMLGNMQVESYLSPAYIENSHRNNLPNSASDISDVPNSVMLSFYSTNSSGYGIGLVQWDGYTNTAPSGQKLVSFAERYNLDWFDGDTQLFRILREYETNIQWQNTVIDGVTWTWQRFISNNETPEKSADIWRRCYERGGDSSIARRRQNARYWYTYFFDNPPTPPLDGWIDGETFASFAKSYDPNITGVQIPYSQMDCIAFVNKVWQDIYVVAENGWSLTNGTNSLWRSTRTFNTSSPNNQTPCPELWYKDTIINCLMDYDEIPPGTLLFHKIGNDDFAHIGIYVGNDEVMQSGGLDSASVPGGGVHRSAYDSSAWNYCAFVVWVNPSGYTPTPPALNLATFLALWHNIKKGVTRNVKRTI